MVNTTDDQVVDFSNYGQKQPASNSVKQSELETMPAIQPLPVKSKFFTKKLFILIGILVILILAQIIIILLSNPNRENQIPDGYKKVQPTNGGPIRTEPIK